MLAAAVKKNVYHAGSWTQAYERQTLILSCPEVSLVNWSQTHRALSIPANYVVHLKYLRITYLFRRFLSYLETQQNNMGETKEGYQSGKKRKKKKEKKKQE